MLSAGVVEADRIGPGCGLAAAAPPDGADSPVALAGGALELADGGDAWVASIGVVNTAGTNPS
jgi:hypothetical protein